jgi:uncharacterized protein (DUF1778 family)
MTLSGGLLCSAQATCKKAAPMSARSIRTEKLDLRLTPDAKRKLRAAAELAHRSVSEFVLTTALTRADELLSEQRDLRLTREQWTRFMQALDAPPRSHARMEKLLREPSVFERP